MERNKILERLNEIAKKVFENQDIVLSEATAAADIEEWDSLTHFILLKDIEDEFCITFTSVEMSETQNIGDLIDAIISKVK